MSNENETPKTPETPPVDIDQIVKSAVENAINSFKTKMDETYQAKIAEAVQASHASIITPAQIEVSSPNATLDFVKQTLNELAINRENYGKFKTHKENDMAKNKILILKAAYPELTAEEIHKELFETE